MNESRGWRVLAVLALVLLGTVAPARASEWLCDASYQDCRAPLLTLIRNEQYGIDVAFWFMEDARISTEIIKRWQAGVPVRVIVDQRANPAFGGTHPINAEIVQTLVAAGIPIRQRALTNGDILHWKMMLFVGQNTVEFSGANYSSTAFVPQTPYVDFEDEAIYFTDEPSIVNSFKTKYDDLWIDPVNYADYANILTPPARVYPIFTKDPELNFPQQESYANRVLGKYPKEKQRVDIIMFRITDERETNAIIATVQRGIPVRLITDLDEYRVPKRQWVSYNLDKLWASGVQFRVRAHQGLNHQKLVMFYSQGLSIFGSSNFTTPSDNKQQEHNYFTVKPWIFDWFAAMFERKWCSGPWAAGMPAECAGKQNPVNSDETTDFVPLPPDKPVNTSPVNLAINQATTGLKLKWNPGFYAHFYDVYFGVDPNPPLYQANLHLGPSDAATKNTLSITLPTLQPGTTYYWRIVSRTMAGLTARGPISSFTTKGIPPPPPPPPPGATTQVIWAADVQPTAMTGRWASIVDPTAAGGVALWNADRGNAKISPPLAAPSNYFEAPVQALSGVPYHVWIRLRAQSNSLSNNSVSVQFDDSVDPFGTPAYRIGSAAGMELILTDPSGALSGWGWTDNSGATFGADVYFAASGTHTIRVQQRADGAVIDQIVISPDRFIRVSPGLRRFDQTQLASTVSGAAPAARMPLPDPWRSEDIGIVGINGFSTLDPAAGTVTLVAGGGDAWGAADGMYYAYQPLTGDGSIVAHVASVQKAATWSRAGVMIRESTTAGAANAFAYVTGGTSSGFQRRRAAGAATFATVVTAASPAAPRWIRLDRAGDVLTAYLSADGQTWSFAGADVVAMPPTVLIGLGATSALVTASSTSVFDSVAVTAGTPVPAAAPPIVPPLPDGWSAADVGNVGFTGAASFDAAATSFTLKGAGKDIGGASDAFQFAWRALTGDGVVVARVRKLQNISSLSKAGVMIRQSLEAGSPHAFMGLTPTGAASFQRRAIAGGATVSTPGPLATVPSWVMIERIGATVNAYVSADALTWTLVGSDTIPFDATVLAGLAVVSHDTMNTATAVFDNVAVR